MIDKKHQMIDKKHQIKVDLIKNIKSKLDLMVFIKST